MSVENNLLISFD